YMIARYDAKAGLTLVRNPRFHVWSEAAQPAGFPDTIEYTFHVSAAGQVKAVEDNRADWMADDPPRGALHTLTTEFAGRIHPYAKQQTFYLALNTTMAPFDDVRVRRAISYAVDRRAMVAISGGSPQGRVTCQFLPPNFPGYQPYCPYTVNPNRATGAWTAPNLPKARKLIAQAGVAGARVQVWAAPYAAQWGPYVVGLLRRSHFH